VEKVILLDEKRVLLSKIFYREIVLKPSFDKLRMTTCQAQEITGSGIYDAESHPSTSSG